MIFSELLATTAAVVHLSLAQPHGSSIEQNLQARDNIFPPLNPRCLTRQTADETAGIFQSLIQNYTTELALEALTEDFVDWSSAVNIIMNKGAQLPKNITGPTFDSREAFMAGQGWMTLRSANGQAKEVASIPVIGNAIITVVPAEDGNRYKYRVKELFSEFNAAAWLVNLGVFVPNGALLPVDDSQSAKRAAAIELWEGDLRGPAI